MRGARAAGWLPVRIRRSRKVTVRFTTLTTGHELVFFGGRLAVGWSGAGIGLLHLGASYSTLFQVLGRMSFGPPVGRQLALWRTAAVSATGRLVGGSQEQRAAAVQAGTRRFSPCLTVLRRSGSSCLCGPLVGRENRGYRDASCKLRHAGSACLVRRQLP